jgi:hypothetical protein
MKLMRVDCSMENNEVKQAPEEKDTISKNLEIIRSLDLIPFQPESIIIGMGDQLEKLEREKFEAITIEDIISSDVNKKICQDVDKQTFSYLQTLEDNSSTEEA